MALFAVAAALTVSVAQTLQAPTLVLNGVPIVDVAVGQLVPDQTAAVAGDTIVRVTPAGSAHPTARVIDGRGKFLIPARRLAEMWASSRHT